jgi:hypothetical protein
MIALICFVLAVLASPLKSKSRLEAENAVGTTYKRALPRKVLGRDYRVPARPDDLTALFRVLDYHFSIDTHGDDDAQATGL